MNARNVVFLIIGLIVGGTFAGVLVKSRSRDHDNASPQVVSKTTAPPLAARNRSTVQGPSAERVERSIQQAVTWLAANPLHPTRGELLGFRFYALEVRTWYILYVFEQDQEKRAGYLAKTKESVGRLRDGSELLKTIESELPRKYIADLLVVADVAKEVGMKLPAIEKALPNLIERGLEAPNRPMGLQVALSWLIRKNGYDQGPSVEELRTIGMLAGHPPEMGMIDLTVYIFTHEIFGLTDYGLRREPFTAEEHTYLDRTLPFWTLYAAVRQDADLGAELAICDQVVGLTDEYAYGQIMELLLLSQSPEGFFRQQKTVTTPGGHVHTIMVVLHALLGHVALMEGRPLPLEG